MAVNIDIEDLTNGSLNVENEWEGTGVFDKLIHAVNKNIEGEYQKGRITGTDYANVYLGSMQAVIAQSMQYVLQERQVEAQVDVLKLEEAAKQYELDNILPAQLEKLEAEIDNIVATTKLTNRKVL